MEKMCLCKLRHMDTQLPLLCAPKQQQNRHRKVLTDLCTHRQTWTSAPPSQPSVSNLSSSPISSSPRSFLLPFILPPPPPHQSLHRWVSGQSLLLHTDGLMQFWHECNTLNFRALLNHAAFSALIFYQLCLQWTRYKLNWFLFLLLELHKSLYRDRKRQIDCQINKTVKNM